MRGGPTYEHERVSFNLAKLRKAGEQFEVVIDPDLAIAFREGDDVDLKELLKAEKIFSDAKKGLLASEEHMKTVFGSADTLVVAKKILSDGEIQLTAEHRQRIREEKKKRLLEQIRINAIDPRTNTPHPAKRIELAFDEAKVHIDETKSVEAQIKDVVKKLQPILPIRFESATMRIHLSAEYAQKLYGDVKNFGTIKKEDWMNDGSWVCYVELPAGLQNELIDMLNAKTHGGVEVERVER